MNKNTWVIGFTLFAMFFGAGNLIFQVLLKALHKAI
ncbi:TPA: branched-chain amino acid transport system II carrier protein [Staphylococcus aureus]|nr:branched-chain amino acid transport system II carrier protein [Staphylococcus aureus]HDH5334053.1 branched-chain amino acid transport system II carrier protein [Staphylococcus aureus]HDJ4914985.1 branched-chain amino acid transport system II carrier protein [Staphylococcus aureus]